MKAKYEIMDAIRKIKQNKDSLISYKSNVNDVLNWVLNKNDTELEFYLKNG